MPAPKLSKKQLDFVEHYLSKPLSERDAQRSADFAGYTGGAAASQLMNNPKIKAELVARDQATRSGVAKIDSNWFLTEAIHLWETPLGGLFDDDGSLKRIVDMSPEAQRLLGGFKIKQSYEVDEDDTVVRTDVIDVKLIDRIKVLDMIGRNTDVNAYGDREKAEAAGSFSDLLRALSGAVTSGDTIDAELVQKLVGDT